MCPLACALWPVASPLASPVAWALSELRLGSIYNGGTFCGCDFTLHFRYLLLGPLSISFFDLCEVLGMAPLHVHMEARQPSS